MKNLPQLLAVVPAAALAAIVSLNGCDAEQPEPELAADGHDDARADNAFRVSGYCSPDDCGDQSSTGTCWCDDQCESYGDCCDNKALTCDEPPVIAQDEACGERIIGNCDEGLVCQRNPNSCFVRDFWGTCQPEVTDPICPAVYMPVCGCDEVTYSNACALGNGSLAYDGVCNGDIGGMCGGIAGFQCVEGSHCELEGDFPDAAGTCVEDAADSCSNHCDGQSEDGSCWCDEACVGYGDCCADINTFCG